MLDPRIIARRRFLAGLSCSTASLVLTGCGGGSANAVPVGAAVATAGLSQSSVAPASGGGGCSPTHFLIPPQPDGAVVNGRVILSDFLKNPSYSVSSMYEIGAPVSATGTFSLTVSNQRAMPLFLIDDQDRVAGMLVSVPGTALEFSATSTALAAVLLAPGIFENDPATMTALIAKIQALGQFQTASAALRSALQTQVYQAALTAAGIANAFVDTVVALTAQGIGTQSLQPGAAVDGFSITVQGADSLQLSNAAWRGISVDRLIKDADGNALSVASPVTNLSYGTDLNLMTGAVPLAIDFSALFGKTGNPTTALDQHIPDGAAATIEYWIQGPGNGSSTGPLPPQISSSISGPAAYSAWTYALSPFLNIFFSGLLDISKISATIIKAAATGAGVVNAIQLFVYAQAFSTATTVFAKANAIYNMCAIVVQLLIDGLVEQFGANLSLTLLAAAEKFFTWINVIIFAGNFARYAIDVLTQDSVASITVTVGANLDITVE